MVATAAQIAANRANASRSTGPRTPEGKAASSRNALTHGAHAADDTILATAPDTYLDDFRAHFQPVGILEEHLVTHLAVLASRRDRLNAAMDALLELNERHALMECQHERYGINTPNGHAMGQPSWQPAMRRYDGHPEPVPHHPELVSDPALDPDPILCSLAYTLSGPRAAALFRHEAAVDRRFSATLKDLTTLQSRRRAAAAAEATALPTGPCYEPRLQRALDHHLRQSAAPDAPPRDATPEPRAHHAAPIADQSQSAVKQNEPGAPTTAMDGRGAGPAHPETEPSTTVARNKPNSPAVVAPARLHPEAVFLPRDEPTTFLSVLPRHPGEQSSIPAHWSDAPLPGQ